MFWVGVIINLLSYRKELRLIIAIFLVVLLVPIITVIIIANTGIQVVSDTLVKLDPVSKAVQIFDPEGKTYKTLDLKTIWPVKGVLTLEFGQSDLPYQLLHTGIDIANPYGKVGDPVRAFMSGTVTYAGEVNWGYGKHVILDHGNNISSLYGHLDQILVKQGQKIEQGQIIGTEGQTGWATGPHLHFQINIFGIPVNPREFLGN